MSDDPAELLGQFRNRGVLLDSNLLVLLLVGLVDRRMVSRHPHTKQFSSADFELIRDVVWSLERLVTTPHVLTEVSNLGPRKLPEEYRREFLLRLAWFVDLARENQSLAARDLLTYDSYLALGLPDTAILAAVGREVLLVTADENLTSVAKYQGFAVLPFYLLQQLDS